MKTSSLLTNACEAQITRDEPALFHLSPYGDILTASANAAELLGMPGKNLLYKNLHNLLIRLNPSWNDSLLGHRGQDDICLLLPDSERPLRLRRLRISGGSMVMVEPVHPDSAADPPQDAFEHHAPAAAPLTESTDAPRSTLLDLYNRHFPGLAYIQRPDFSFAWVNPGAANQLNLDIDFLSLPGEDVLRLIHEDDRECVRETTARAAMRRKSVSLNYRIFDTRDNAVRHILDLRSPRFDPAGNHTGYEGIWLDITRQAVAESRIASLAWKESLASLTAGLIHDFSNVMAGIFSISELYYDGMDEGNPMFAGLGQIKKSSMEARRLVRRIVDLNREEPRSAAYHNIEHLLREQLDLLEVILPKGTRLNTHFTEQEIAVYIDDVNFRRLILNLGLNAADALGRQGTVDIEVRRVRAGDRILEKCINGPLRTERNGVEITFSDDGSGIDPEHLHHVFDAYFTTKEHTKGSGFGLYNAKLFAENNAGAIGVTSTPGNGTTFKLYLPEATFNETGESPEDTAQSPAFDGRRPALVVYSCVNPDNFGLIETLRSHEWEVSCFTQPEALCGFLDECSSPPHGILLLDLGRDRQLVQLASRLAQADTTPHIAVQIHGRDPSEFPTALKRQVSAVFGEETSDAEVVKILSNLVQSAS